MNQDGITVSIHTRYGKLKTTEEDRLIIKKLIQTATHAYTSLKFVKKDSIDYGSGPGSAHCVWISTGSRAASTDLLTFLQGVR